MSTAYFHACPETPCRCFTGPWRTVDTVIPSLSGSVNQAFEADERHVKERELCTCGLVAVGYRASWAISHVDACPAAALFED
jgi:hypothetical protein